MTTSIAAGVGGAVRFLVVDTIGKEERPPQGQLWMEQPMRKKFSPWAHGDHGGLGSGPNDHGSVTARRGHSEVTARSRRDHGIFSMITARSQLNHGPGHGSVTAGCDHFGHHGELTVSSRWAVTVANFCLMGVLNFTQILAYLVHNMNRSLLYLGFGHFDWLPFLSVNNILAGLWLNCISSVEITIFLLADISLQHRSLFQC